MRSLGFDVRGTFNVLLNGKVAEIQDEINAALGTSYSIAVLTNRQVETFPSVRIFFLTSGGLDSRRRKFVDRVVIDVFTRTNPTNPDYRLPNLITHSIFEKLGFSSSGNAIYNYESIKGYFDDTLNPATVRLFRIELDDPAGWEEVQGSDPDIIHFQCGLNIFYRGD